MFLRLFLGEAHYNNHAQVSFNLGVCSACKRARGIVDLPGDTILDLIVESFFISPRSSLLLEHAMLVVNSI